MGTCSLPYVGSTQVPSHKWMSGDFPYSWLCSSINTLILFLLLYNPLKYTSFCLGPFRYSFPTLMHFYFSANIILTVVHVQQSPTTANTIIHLCVILLRWNYCKCRSNRVGLSLVRDIQSPFPVGIQLPTPKGMLDLHLESRTATKPLIFHSSSFSSWETVSPPRHTKSTQTMPYLLSYTCGRAYTKCSACFFS